LRLGGTSIGVAGSPQNGDKDLRLRDLAGLRTKRIAAGISQNNLNREHAYLRSVFNELKRLGQWKRDNPLEALRAFKIQQTELAYLTDKQIETLLQSMESARNPHVAYSSDRGQRFHSDGGHHSALMADSFSHALGPLPSMS
jgi:integrase